MPAYNFKKRFKPMVIDGSKRHTIRAKRTRNIQRVSAPCYLYYGMRTKQCEFLLGAPCTAVQDVVIVPKRGLIVVDGERLAADELDALAWRDGFRPLADSFDGAWDEMRRYWSMLHPKLERFFGDLIHWDYDRRITERKAR